MERLPIETQTLYAELMERLTATETHRSIGRISGCFTTKTVKSESYYYFQYSDPGGITRQVYIGKKSLVLDKMVKQYLEEREEFKEDIGHIQRLCAQMRAGGMIITDMASSRVIKSFADSGVFALKGVLVGTHAFTVLGNLLGVRWKGAGLKTNDIDIAGESVVNIALPDIQTDIPKILENLQMGFIPIPPLNLKDPSTSFRIRGKSLRVDFLTPVVKPTRTGAIYIPRFNVAAQPMRFLDYLIENPERGIVINGGGILVNVPAPGRFAFHKLIVTQERPLSMHGKADKDLIQAAQVFSVLIDERPGDLLLAWDEVKNRGKGWSKRIFQGISNLERKHNDVSKRLKNLLRI
ncbi:MAG: hypothetical protein HY279_13190 [Nitrospinae bacterium]|nr:hypothetical protein [Nitrospinota bacterium]